VAHDYQSFSGVSGTSAADVWAVGVYDDFDQPYENPLMEHWDGSSWVEIDGPSLEDGGSLLGVLALSPTDVWAVGGRGEIPARTLVEHWNGSAWTVVPSPSPGQRFTGSDLTALAEHDC